MADNIDLAFLQSRMATLQADMHRATGQLSALRAKVDRMDRDLTDMRERLEEIAAHVREGFEQVAETQGRMLDILQAMAAKPDK